MRLFRQAVAGDWSTVLGGVGAALIDLMRDLGTGDTLATTAAPLVAALHDPPMLAHGAPVARAIARARRTRVGMMQYLPGSDDASRSIEDYGERFREPPGVEQLAAFGNCVQFVNVSGVRCDTHLG
jgi:hypothetical protein